MGKTQHIQCLACGTPVPMVMQTTGMYEGMCPHCGVGACLVIDAMPSSQRRWVAVFTVTDWVETASAGSRATAAPTAPVACPRSPRQG